MSSLRGLKGRSNPKKTSLRGLKGRSNLISINQDATMTPGFVYILTNKNNTTLYVGVTSDIVYRIKQHKEKQYPKSFTARYNLDKLVYYEVFQMIGDAIGREKQLKAGSRAKKIALIESINPNWRDLYEDIVREFGNELDEIAALRSQ